MKTVTNLLALFGSCALILVVLGAVMKAYWSLFLFGWGLF